MDRPPPRAVATVPILFEGQVLHALLLAVLLAGLWAVSGTRPVASGQLLGVDSSGWLWITGLIAVAHQLWVWFCWRTQLHHGLLTRWFGARGFTIHAAVFALLGTGRLVATTLLALANAGTAALPSLVLRALAVAALLPALYVLYSVQRYFTFRRALGIDHFDARYGTLPFVREGIFRYTKNAMYTFGFLVLWVPGLAFASAAALWAALFQHLYIWVHYFATELPDIRRIYGRT